MKVFKSALKKGYLFFIFTLLYIPIIILILYSFNESKYSLVWHGFSLRWYHLLAQDSELWLAFGRSLFLGVLSSLIASIGALILCTHLFLHSSNKNQTNRFLNGLLLLMIIIPDLVMGIALLIFFNISGIPLGFMSLLIAHITFCLPFSIVVIQNRMQLIDIHIYQSALDLGASKFKAFTKVLFPIIAPAFLSAILLDFTLSFDDVIISYFIAGPDFSILPLAIYGLVRMGVTPELNALCTITLMTSVIVVIFAHFLSRKSDSCSFD